jgi:hypothetical protein
MRVSLTQWAQDMLFTLRTNNLVAYPLSRVAQTASDSPCGARQIRAINKDLGGSSAMRMSIMMESAERGLVVSRMDREVRCATRPRCAAQWGGSWVGS